MPPSIAQPPHVHACSVSLPCTAGLLYCNRALALLQRGWEGDAVAALADAELALALDASNHKAHFR